MSSSAQLELFTRAALAHPPGSSRQMDECTERKSSETKSPNPRIRSIYRLISHWIDVTRHVSLLYLYTCLVSITNLSVIEGNVCKSREWWVCVLLLKDNEINVGWTVKKIPISWFSFDIFATWVSFISWFSTAALKINWQNFQNCDFPWKVNQHKLKLYSSGAFNYNQALQFLRLVPTKITD